MAKLMFFILIIGVLTLVIYLTSNQDKTWKDELLEWALKNGLQPDKGLINFPSFSGQLHEHMCVIYLYPLGIGTEINHLTTRVDVFFRAVISQSVVKILNNDEISKKDFFYLNNFYFDLLINQFNAIKLHKENLLLSGASLSFFQNKISYFARATETKTENIDDALKTLILLARQIEHASKIIETTKTNL